MNIFCTGNKTKKNFFECVRKLNEITSQFNHQLHLDNKLIDGAEVVDFDNIIYSSLNDTTKLYDLVISIGGDGALLHTIRLMNEKQIPVLGIHIGNLGFLNQINNVEISKSLSKLFSMKKISYQKFNLIEANVISNTHSISLMALNDIVINHGNLLRLIKMRVNLEETVLNDYSCDGIIFSTSLGSTAYSLSAGGPIVSPEIGTMVITPVSAHSLSSRPIVLSDQCKISVKFLQEYSKVNITADGQEQHTIDSNANIIIKKSKVHVKLIKFDGMENYYSRLKNKLNWIGKN